MKTKLLSVICLLLAAGVYAAGNMPAGVQVSKTSAGASVLADSKGMTLYTFGRDTTPEKSACNGQCAMNWPALAATADAKAMGDWTVITRDDGSKQWAYKGKPLYTFAKDAMPGDAKGDGVGNGAWKVAMP